MNNQKSWLQSLLLCCFFFFSCIMAIEYEWNNKEYNEEKRNKLNLNNVFFPFLFLCKIFFHYYFTSRRDQLHDETIWRRMVAYVAYNILRSFWSYRIFYQFIMANKFHSVEWMYRMSLASFLMTDAKINFFMCCACFKIRLFRYIFK